MAEHAVVAEDEVDLSRRKFLTRATIATGTVGAVFATVPFIESWSPSESARAQGIPAMLDLSKIEPGQMTTAVWRRSPIYVVRRTEEMIARIAGHDALLKDPNSENSIQPPYAHNALRSRSSEFLVLVGTCTHLGCLPKQRFGAGELYPSWPGGFFCPCHGSRFDLAGRVFSGSRSKRSEEHTSELQSRLHLVCRLLLEKKKKNHNVASNGCISPFLNDIVHVSISIAPLNTVPIS